MVSKINKEKLRIIANRPIPLNIKSVLESHQESLVICVDPDKNESNIVVFSKLLNNGVLSKYLIELLKNLLKTAKHEQPQHNINSQTPIGAKTHHS